MFPNLLTPHTMTKRIFTSISLFSLLATQALFGQIDNNLYIGGTANASFMSNKPISTNPWTQSTNRYDISILPEIGLASNDGNRFFGFGLGVRLGKGTMFNPDEKIIGAIVGAHYRKVFPIKSPLQPYYELSLNATIGQTKIQQSGSEFFSVHINNKIGLMYNPENKWRFFIGINVFSLQYERFSNNQLFRVGIHNTGALNINIIRML
jgi:hypothetical protein